MRQIIASNRLAFSIRVSGKNISYQPSVGGVTSALTAYLKLIKKNDPDAKCVWIGWPGNFIEKEMQDTVRQKALDIYNAIPIFLSKEEEKKFYYGFCNKTIWPLFHNFPSYCVFREDYWATYKKVNKIIADEIIRFYKPGDIIFVNDYQLLLVPGYVREHISQAKIGFFLHIPFPHFEIFQLLPRGIRKEIGKGLLGANVVGFHTQDFVNNFLQVVRRLLGKENILGEIRQSTHTTKVVMLPLGVSIEKFTKAVRNRKITLIRKKMKKQISQY